MAVGNMIGQRAGIQTINGESAGPDGNYTIDNKKLGALPTTGGKMTGAIDMSTQSITNVKDPNADGDAVNLKSMKAKILDAVKAYQVILTAEGWLPDQTQTVMVTGVTKDATKTLVQYSSDPSTRTAYMEADVYMSAQGDGNVTFKWNEAKPDAPLAVNVVVRALK